jgi:S1-C subfamily serine protease
MRDCVFAKTNAFGCLCGACSVLFAISVLCFGPAAARATSPSRGDYPEVHEAARGAQPATGGKEKSGTAFFVDDMGDMLTARHVVDDCQRVVVVKDGLGLAAQVLAVSDRADLALIKVPRTLGLEAVFPRSMGAIADDMVFVAAYDNLPNLIASGGLLANATVVANASADGTLEIESNVTFGASGAPVLDNGAHV